MADQTTLAVYAEKAGDYAQRFGTLKPGHHLSAFLQALPPSARVLDLGCGPGNAAAILSQAGHEVDAWDASPEMAKLAEKQFGIIVRIAEFDTLDSKELYDGIYANFSLLHAPKQELPGILLRIAAALKVNGILHIGLKIGKGERRDKLGRFYAYYSEAEIVERLAEAGLHVTSVATGEEAGLDGTVSPWIILQARPHD